MKIVVTCGPSYEPIDQVRQPENANETITAFGGLAERYHLYLVDWCRTFRASSNPEFQNYFSHRK